MSMLRALLLAAAAGQSYSIIAAAHSVVFRNEMDEDATLYWVDPATKQKTKVGVAKAYGGELPQNTHVGHQFHYEGGHSVGARI